MKRIALLLALAGCARHPALTVGIGAGLVAGVTCEANEAPQKTCGIITGVVALGLGGLAWLITTLADTSAHELPPDEEITPEGTVKLHTHTDLPPVVIDAGVPDAMPDSAVVDAAPLG